MPTACTAAASSSVALFRTLWGVPFPSKSSEWARYLKDNVINKGFVGIECCAPGPFFSFASDPKALAPVLAEANCRIVFQAQTTDYPVISASWQDHAESLRGKLEAIAALHVTPDLVNVHGGKDSFSGDDAVMFLQSARKSEADILSSIAHSGGGAALRPPPSIAFETHRQRLFHSPFQLLDVVRRLEPDDLHWLKLNADLSHFVVSLERFSSAVTDEEFWPAVMKVLEEHVVYMHARCCTPQAIQIAAFPSEQGGDEGTLIMTQWWKQIAQAMRRRGLGEVRVCPEYGPPPYQPIDAVSGAPIGDLDALVLNAAHRLRSAGL